MYFLCREYSSQRDTQIQERRNRSDQNVKGLKALDFAASILSPVYSLICGIAYSANYFGSVLFVYKLIYT